MAKSLSTWSYRRPERLLIGLLIMVIGVGYFAIVAMQGGAEGTVSPGHFLLLLVFAASACLAHLALLPLRSRADVIVLPAVLFLVGVGTLVRVRLQEGVAAFPPSAGELMLPAAMLLFFLTVAMMRNGRYRTLAPAYSVALLGIWVVLGLLLAFGQRFRGGLYLPGGINPSELAKPLCVIYLAGFLVRYRKAFEGAVLGVPGLGSQATFALLVGWGGTMVLVLLLRDLGLMVLLNAVLLVMVFTLVRKRRVLALGALGVTALVALVFLLSAHSRSRILAWWDPFEDPTGRAWQVLQALSAIYSGGLLGLGLGSGTPQAIPIASSDFVYAVVGEELGYVGCGLLLGVYALLIARCFRIAAATRDLFGRLLATGLGALLAFQVLLNVGGVTKAIPLTGLTLPFVSHGGSSLLTSFIVIGLLLAIAEDHPEAPIAGGRTRGKASTKRPSKAAGSRKKRAPARKRSAARS